MTVQEFKEKFPHLSHLEGNDLWDAMEQSVIKPYIPKEGDEEIVATIEHEGYTFNFSKSAVDMMNEMFPPTKNTFSKGGIIIPQGSINKK